MRTANPLRFRLAQILRTLSPHVRCCTAAHGTRRCRPAGHVKSTTPRGYTMKKYQGVTLIELMIVIAILGILVAIALPAYQDYTVRARVSEAIAQTAPAKLAVAETASAQGILATAVTNAAAAGFTFPNDGTDYVASISIANGVITTTTKDTGAETDPILTFTPSQASETAPVNWACSTNSGTERFVPAECRTSTPAGGN